MKKLFVIVAALIGLAIVDVSSAEAAGGWRWRRRSNVTYVSAQSVTVAQGQPNTGYRTYSYQPTAEAVTPTYRRTTKVAPYMEAGRHSAGYKLTDF